MRRILPAALIGLLTAPLLPAQAPAHIDRAVSVQRTAAGADTLTTYLDRMSQAYVLRSAMDGFMLGSSNDFDETAVHYDVAQPVAMVTGVLLFAGPRQVMGPEDVFEVRFHAAGSDSMPTTLVGHGSFGLLDLAPEGFSSYIPVQLTGASPVFTGFLVSVYHPGDDSLCILSSAPSGDGLGEMRTRQHDPLRAEWIRSHDHWTVGGQPYDGDALILPIVEYASTATDPAYTQGGLGLLRPWPQPAASEIHLPMRVSHAGTYTLGVHDATGRLVHQQAMQAAPGEHMFSLDTRGWAAGTYFHVVSGGKGSVAGKFEIIH